MGVEAELDTARLDALVLFAGLAFAFDFCSASLFAAPYFAVGDAAAVMFAAMMAAFFDWDSM